MRVDIVDVLGIEPGVGQAGRHRRGRPVDRRRDDIGGVSRHAGAGKLGQDRRAPRHRMFIGFQHRHAGAFADHQPVPVGGEGPAGFLGDRPKRLPPLQHAIDKRRVGAAGQHGVGAAEPDLVCGQRDRVIGRSAGGGNAEHRPAQAIVHADLSSRGSGHDARDGEHVGAAAPLDEEPAIILLGRPGTEDAGSDHRSDAPFIVFGDGQAGLADRLARRNDGQQAEAVHGDEPLAIDAVLRQGLDFCADADLEFMQGRRGDFAYGRAAGPHLPPDGVDVDAQAANAAEAGDDDAPAHGRLRLSWRSGRVPLRRCRRRSSDCSRHRPCSSRSRCRRPLRGRR